jgi:hypothetical protein
MLGLFFLRKENQMNINELKRAKLINKSLGTYIAARYMFLRGWSFEAALFTLIRK